MASEKKQFMPALPLIVIVVIVFALGYGLGLNKGQKSADSKLQKISEKVKNYFPASPEDVRALGGIVTEVKDDAVVFDFGGFGNPLEDDVKVRTAVVGENTAILKRSYKEPQEYDKEYQEYSRLVGQATETGQALPEPPQPFTDVEAEIDDIVVGNNVFVEAQENIKNATRFTVTKIVIQ